MDDGQLLFNIIVGVAGMFGGWILNNISRSIERLDKDVRQDLIPVLVKAIQELKAELDATKAEVAALKLESAKNRIVELENK